MANYPYDGYPDRTMQLKKTRNPTPDDATFLFLAKYYASHHTRMSKSQVRLAPLFGRGAPVSRGRMTSC